MFKRFTTKDKDDISTIRLEPGFVLIKVTEEFLRALMTRTDDGKRMYVAMGNVKDDGTYEPQITVEDDGKAVVDVFVLEEWRVFKAREAKANRPKRGGGLVTIKGGRVEPVQ
jgi:hypothetical protein